ncbi:protein CASPARIAN STRIP INTEGRITY FACTOR 1-like [Rhododendron vialii]|uniref:protein CASPARIAN STRIP INTEGRITY FACTOR 1-like n=1 Tax=Rhododendron vialii TaxID=182163 RepID=UPI00265F9DBB|nr:protein CASPARIAN STRIP INTEGRITY FACTOR 1-like [Rhododendron vialii]
MSIGGFMMLKKIGLLLLVSVSIISTSSSGRELVNNLIKDIVTAREELSAEMQLQHKEAYTVHERLLRVNTKDYGTYDPAPEFEKPPFKRIPN